MPFRLFWWAHVATAITTTGGVCFLAFLKSMVQAACASDSGSLNQTAASVSDLRDHVAANATDSQQSLSSNHSQAITASLAWAAAAVVANAAILMIKSSAKQRLAVAAAICAKWQPVYFLMVSIERIVFLAVMIAADVKDPSAGSCAEILATSLLMTVALLLFSLSAICCDYDPNFTPAMRRGAYCASFVCFLLDLMCSFFLGSRLKTDPFCVGHFCFNIANQITSCITSQVVILLHLLYISCQSREGRGWAYESLRFELVSSSSNGALEGIQCQEVQAQVRSNAFSRLRDRVLRFRTQRLRMSKVFAIPCVHSDSNLTTGFTASGLELARPLFRIKFPNFIIRYAELHGNRYVCLVAIVGLVSFVCNFTEKSHYAVLVFITIVFYGILGFFSCKRHNIDSVAAKHVATSFRFAVICFLLLFLFALEVRLAIRGQQSPQSVTAYTVMMLGFILCLLVDCSPNLSTIAQTAISVRSCITPFSWQQLTRVSQATWCIIFGYAAYQQASQVLREPGEQDCFLSLGTYSMCTTATFFPIFSNLFFLMAQAFMSRLLVPGVSIFVNASVRCPPHCICQFRITTLQLTHYQKARAQKHLTRAADFGLRQAATCCN
jgi:hypothetical protein